MEEIDAREAEAADLMLAASVEAEAMALEACMRAVFAAWETLFWREAALGTGTGTTTGTCDFAAEAAALIDAPAWVAFWLADWAAPAIACEADLAAAEGGMVMAVEGRETLDGS